MSVLTTYHVIAAKWDAETNATHDVWRLAHVLCTTSQHHVTVTQHYLLPM